MASVYKRTKASKVWWGRVERDGKVNRKSLRTNDKRVAQKRLDQWVAEIDGAEFGEKPDRTYKELAVSFMMDHLPTISPKSQERYLGTLKILDPFLRDSSLKTIDKAKMAEIEANRRAQGITESTIRREFACLSSMFTHAIVDLEWTDTNPVTLYMKRQARRGRMKPGDPRRRYLSHKEEELLLQNAVPPHLKHSDLPDMIAFAIDTGLRLDEQLSLTWGQVDREKNLLTVTGKGDKERRVPILPRALEILKRQPRHIRRANQPDYVFNNKDGERYGKRTRGLAGAVKRSGIPHLQWHDLRRTCGCRRLQDAKMQMKAVSLWLGHASSAVTERHYAFLEIENLQDAVTETGTGHPHSKNKESVK